LDKLEQGELRTVAAQVLKATDDIKDGASLDHFLPRARLIMVRSGMKRMEAVALQFETEFGTRDGAYYHVFIVMLVRAHTRS
jgi:hypothetical protein